MGTNKQIKIGALLSYLSIAINIVAGLIYTPWLVNQIGQSDYGLYTLANSLISLFLVDFGLSSAISRYISKYRAENNQQKIDNFLGAVYKLYLVIDTLIFIVLIVIYFFIDTIYIKLTPSELEKFKIVYLISASFSVLNFPFVTFNGILNSYEEFIHLKLADLIYRILFVGLTVSALLCGTGLYGLVLSHAIVGLIVVAYKWIIISKKIKFKINWRFSERSLYTDIFKFSIWVTIATLAQRLIFNITPSILGALESGASIAVFGIVSTIEGYAYTITAAINGMLMPKISRICEHGDEQEQLLPLMLAVGKFQYVLNGLIIAGFASVGKQFITLWMGLDYIDAYYGILLVIIPGLFYNSMEIATTAMVVKKEVKLQAFVNLGMGVINVVLAIILTPHLGMIGACISIFTAYIVRAVALLCIYKRVLGVDIGSFIKNCYLRMSAPIIVTIIIGMLVNILIQNNGWISFGIKGLIAVVVYGGLTMILGLNKEERTKIIKIWRN